MAPKCPAQSAARGTLSARQWSDIRQAARLARSEGIPIEMHGITLNSARGSPRPPGRVKAASKVPVPDKGNSSSMEIDDPTAETSKKKQQRDKQRSEDFRERRMLAVRWLPLVQRLLRRTRKKFCDDVWTTWMRSRLAPPPKNAKLRALLWREWTRPQLGSPAENPVLGLLSHRDDFIYARCIAFCRHIETMIEYPKPSDMDELCSFGLDGFDPDGRVAAGPRRLPRGGSLGPWHLRRLRWTIRRRPPSSGRDPSPGRSRDSFDSCLWPRPQKEDARWQVVTRSISLWLPGFCRLHVRVDGRGIRKIPHSPCDLSCKRWCASMRVRVFGDQQRAGPYAPW